MAPFYPVYACRSDGKLRTKKSGHAKDAQDPNEPLPEQLVTKPNAQGIADFYRLCQPGHTKEVDWRKKLAGMLIREIGEAELQDKNFILSALPENYRLYEHIRIKTTDKEGNPTKNKTHAGGGNERQDAYLYGHPQGRKKRYRSPADFFPHLLWLCTDEAGDPNNCSCRFCSPEEIEIEGEAEAKASRQAKAMESKVEGQLQSRKSSQTSAPALSNSNLPRIRSSEQKIDMEYNKFLYRPGEVVWFQRGQAWGLGAIVQRSVLQLAPQRLQYRVQPLSHPMTHPQPVSCMQDQIRNWLAWSPPPCITPELHPNPKNFMKAPTYDEVDWRTFLTGKVSPTDAEVDGSILAAKAVESTYTLFELLGSTVSNPSSAQTSERTFQGLYLGSEKIWIGDPLRLRSPNADANVPANEILILHSIAERQHPEDSSRSAVLLTGDVYTPATAPNGSPVIPKDLSNLPLRVQSDLAAGNAIAAASRTTHYLRLTSKGATFSLTDIKGRWYESSVIMPILAPADYESSKRKGELGDASLWMNGHGDCNRVSMSEKGHRAAWVRCKKREEAFGRSVPANFKLFPTVEEPPNPGPGTKVPNNAVRPPMNSMPHQSLQQQQHQHQQQQHRPVQQQGQASQGQTQQQYAQQALQQAPNQVLQQQQPPNQAQQQQYHYNNQQPQPQTSIPPHQQPFAFPTAQSSTLSNSGQQQQQQQQPNHGPESTFDDLMDYDGAVSEATGAREAQEDGLGGFSSEFDTQGYEGFGVS